MMRLGRELAAVVRVAFGGFFGDAAHALSHRPDAQAPGGAEELTPTPADRVLPRQLYSYGMVPLKEKLPLNFGPDIGVGPTISPPTRSQSGSRSRSALRIHICRSPLD